MHSPEAVQRIASNLRGRWPEALGPYSDQAIVACYNDFSLSVDYGNNDEKFPEWFYSIPDYEKG
jgi:hypothetical protein